MAAEEKALPRWDPISFFPGLESPEFTAAFRAGLEAINDLVRLFDEERIDKQEPAPLDDAAVARFDRVINRVNAVLEQVHLLDAYIYGFISTDSRDNAAQARWSELQQAEARLEQLDARLTAWLGALDADALVARSTVAREHAYLVRQARIAAAHQMSPAEEALAAEMSLTGGNAWGELRRNFASQLTATITLDGQEKELPISALRNLAFSPDRDVRRRAYEAELATWQRAAVPIAAAMNSIKGEVNLLATRRKWPSPLEAALFANNMDRETLEAMFTAARESFPDFRCYLRAKARALGLPALAWYDLFAPVGQSVRQWPLAEAADFIVAQFATYSPQMSGMAARAFRERWIDAEPRAGKEGGAFCMSVRGDESRILANYAPVFGEVSTLAHELGHAYHNVQKASRTMLQRRTPMILAETASIFCQQLVVEEGLRRAEPQEQLAILESSLQDACQVVVDIYSRFLFEQGVFDRRRARELSVDEFNALMLEAQRQTYGDGLDANALHPFMWAAKPHYYSNSRQFYNFPYMFGQLFVLGLYARYRADPVAFKADYDDLLASTGLADAADLAARFGIDIRTPDFWRSSLDVIRADIGRFEALVG